MKDPYVSSGRWVNSSKADWSKNMMHHHMLTSTVIYVLYKSCHTFMPLTGFFHRWVSNVNKCWYFQWPLRVFPVTFRNVDAFIFHARHRYPIKGITMNEIYTAFQDKENPQKHKMQTNDKCFISFNYKRSYTHTLTHTHTHTHIYIYVYSAPLPLSTYTHV